MTAPLRLSAAALAAPTLAALSLAACGGEAPRGNRAPVEPAATPAASLSTDALGAHAPARAIGGETVVFSQILAPAAGDGVIDGDVESQTGAALRLLAEALEEEGLTLADVAQLTLHVVVEPDGTLDAEGAARAWRRSFGNRMQPAAPARTLVGVAGLPALGARVSLSAVADRPGPTPALTDSQ